MEERLGRKWLYGSNDTPSYVRNAFEKAPCVWALIFTITSYLEAVMKQRFVKPAFPICATLAIALPTMLFSQTPVITELGIQNLLFVPIDVTVKFNDNTTETKTISDHDEEFFAAPAGKHIIQMIAGGKTVSIPLDPTTQTGWNFPNSCCAETIKAIQRNGSAGTWDMFWPVQYSGEWQLGIQFSY